MSKGERHVKPFPQAKSIQYFRANHTILFTFGQSFQNYDLLEITLILHSTTKDKECKTVGPRNQIILNIFNSFISLDLKRQ